MAHLPVGSKLPFRGTPQDSSTRGVVQLIVANARRTETIARIPYQSQPGCIWNI
jgi:hypothetical protein